MLKTKKRLDTGSRSCTAVWRLVLGVLLALSLGFTDCHGPNPGSQLIIGDSVSNAHEGSIATNTGCQTHAFGVGGSTAKQWLGWLTWLSWQDLIADLEGPVHVVLHIGLNDESWLLQGGTPPPAVAFIVATRIEHLVTLLLDMRPDLTVSHFRYPYLCRDRATFWGPLQISSPRYEVQQLDQSQVKIFANPALYMFDECHPKNTGAALRSREARLSGLMQASSCW